PDVVLAHLSGDVRQHLVPVAQLHPEHRVAQRFDNAALDLDDAVLLGHVLACPEYIAAADHPADDVPQPAHDERSPPRRSGRARAATCFPGTSWTCQDLQGEQRETSSCADRPTPNGQSYGITRAASSRGDARYS